MKLLNNGFFQALALFALTVAPAVALSGGQAARVSTALPPAPHTAPIPIRNAPFSAEVITQYDHQLANGNHIRRETRGRVFRDPQGRVRTETDLQSSTGVESAENIAIQDPILRELIHLDPKTRTANVRHLTEAPAASVMTNNGSVPLKSGSALLLVPQPAQSNHAAVMPLHPESASPAVTESLGTKFIEGIAVVGSRTSRTVSNGQGEAAVAVTETWFSPQLGMVVESFSDDGESGHISTRLTNIVRGAPNEELFRVPPDYTVKDANHIATVMKH